MKLDPQADLKNIWNALDYEWIVEINKAGEIIFYQVSYECSFVLLLPCKIFSNGHGRKDGARGRGRARFEEFTEKATERLS